MKKRLGIEGNLIILTTALLWSTGGVLIKFIPWGTLSIASLRGLICLSILLAIRWAGRRRGKAEPVRFTKYNVAAGGALLMTSSLFLAANKLTTAANAIVLQYIAPILISVVHIDCAKAQAHQGGYLADGAGVSGLRTGVFG